MSKRVIECNVCGEPLAAANDEELLRQLRAHMETEHDVSAYDEEEGRQLIAVQAYEAGDS